MGAPTSQVQSPQSSQSSGKTGGKYGSNITPPRLDQPQITAPELTQPESIQNNIQSNAISPINSPVPRTGGIARPPQLNTSQPPSPVGSSSGKGSMQRQTPQGTVTFPGQGGQPEMGKPNQYSTTISSWDNSPVGTSNQPAKNGKAKGA